MFVNNLITEQEVKEMEQKLVTMGKTHPDYLRQEARCTEAQELLAIQKKLIKKAGKKGYRPNMSDGYCVITGERIKANQGFTKKDQYGKWEIFSWDFVQEQLEQ